MNYRVTNFSIDNSEQIGRINSCLYMTSLKYRGYNHQYLCFCFKLYRTQPLSSGDGGSNLSLNR